MNLGRRTWRRKTRRSQQRASCGLPLPYVSRIVSVDKSARAKIIVDQVLALDPKFGKAAPPRSAQSTSRTRSISDDPRWEARWSIEYEKGSDGEMWDLVELFVYRQARMTVAVRGEQVIPRFFIPGKWEQIFFPFDSADTVPILPN